MLRICSQWILYMEMIGLQSDMKCYFKARDNFLEFVSKGKIFTSLHLRSEGQTLQWLCKMAFPQINMRSKYRICLTLLIDILWAVWDVVSASVSYRALQRSNCSHKWNIVLVLFFLLPVDTLLRVTSRYWGKHFNDVVFYKLQSAFSVMLTFPVLSERAIERGYERTGKQCHQQSLFQQSTANTTKNISIAYTDSYKLWYKIDFVDEWQ